MTLPNPERAVVDMEKLRGYALNPTHSEGRDKAQAFAAALGLTAADADELRLALLQAIQTEDARPTEQDSFGQKYVVDWLMRRATQQAWVRSVWMVRVGEDFPRLVTCFVRRRPARDRYRSPLT